MGKIQLSFSKILALPVSFACCVFAACAQQSEHYNLVQLLKDNKLVTTPGQQTQVTDEQKQAISTKGIVWLKDVDFKQGTIEVDLRGKDVFLQSFLGIAFHAPDTATYDVVYFRPFNFRHADTLRRKWSVQYMSIPDYDYVRLRKEHPLVYENAVYPVPNPNDWFHATIVMKDDWITVFVDHSEKASLKVKLLNNREKGMIGLWTSPPLSDDFANLTLTQ
jgi:hypothetical protein